MSARHMNETPQCIAADGSGIEHSMTRPQTVDRMGFNKLHWVRQSWPFALCALGTLTFLIYTLLQLSIAENSVPITIEPTVFDAGSVMEGSLTGSFAISNSSQDRFRVVSVSKSCDCTDIKASTSILPPAGSMPIDFTWSTVNKQGATESSFVIVLSRVIDDGTVKDEKPPYRLLARLKADVHQRWWMEPRTLVFREGVDSALSRIRVAPQISASILKATCSHPALNAEVVENGNSVLVSINRKLWLASSTAQIVVSTGDAEKIAMPINVSVQ